VGGRVEPLEFFRAEEIERAKKYHRPLYWSMLADLVIGTALLAVLSFSPWGDWLYRQLGSLPWWGRALAFTGITLGLAFVLRLPLSYWRGYVHEKQWEFSMQSVGGWLVDRLKGLAVALVLTAGMLLGFLAFVRAWPNAWPAIVAPAGALLVLVLTFVAPVLLEPIFNKFASLEDRTLADEIRALAERAGVPIRDVLVADASRRTRKENAYVSGLGSTRRVVIYDTLLRRGGPRQVSLVSAHELGHRRLRHVAQGTVVGMAGMVAGVLVLWGFLSSHAILRAIGASRAGDPRVIPFVLLAGAVMQLLASPFESALSRKWESDADRFSLELTGDLEVFEESHRDLATSNLIDLDPPKWLYRFLFSHPTPPERIAAARRWAAEKGEADLSRAKPSPPTRG
jgi:STE24 endopeptidase